MTEEKVKKMTETTKDMYVACSKQVKAYVDGYVNSLEDQNHVSGSRLKVTFEKQGVHKRKDIAAVVEASEPFLREANPDYLIQDLGELKTLFI